MGDKQKWLNGWQIKMATEKKKRSLEAWATKLRLKKLRNNWDLEGGIIENTDQWGTHMFPKTVITIKSLNWSSIFSSTSIKRL